MKGDFKTHVGGILAGMSRATERALMAPTGYLRQVVIATGLLRREGLREAVRKALAAGMRTPAAVICYVLGNDTLVDEGATLYGEPRTFRHDAAFTVIVVDTDARGQQMQLQGSALAPGILGMVGDMRATLSGLQFPGEGEQAGETFDFNESPLTPAGVEPIDQVPNASAYAVHFLTHFFFTTPDRRESPVTIEEIRFAIDVLNGISGPGGLPGVHAEVSS